MLNKNGWGIREMLILSGVLALFLIIAAFYIYSLYKVVEEPINNNYYHNMEDKLEDEVSKYLDNYYEGKLTSDVITISLDVLKAHDLDANLMDSEGNACTGYAQVYKSRGITNIDTYIKCQDYVTDGYEEWREK